MTLDRLRCAFEYALDDRVRIDPVCFTFEIEENPVADNSIGDRSNVLTRYIKAIVQESADFPENHQCLRTSRTRAVPDEPRRQRMGVRRPRMCRHGNPDRVVLNRPGNWNRA